MGCLGKKWRNKEKAIDGWMGRYNLVYHKVLKVPQVQYTFWKVDAEIDEWTYDGVAVRDEFTVPLDVKTEYNSVSGGKAAAINTGAVYVYALVEYPGIFEWEIVWTVNFENADE